MYPLALLAALALAPYSLAAPAAPPTPTYRYASNNPNNPLWGPDSAADPSFVPEAIRGSTGGKVLGPQNVPADLQNPDALAPPSTDNGDVPNFKWPFSLSHNRLADGGWSRQQNVHQMPLATDLAGVNMMLKPGAVREMHWHTTAEWAYMLKGDVRISTITPAGQIYLADVTAGDLWYFPPGHAHSIQAKNSTAAPAGAEFLLVFDSGAFSEDATFLLTDWLAHVPKAALLKNFGLPPSSAAFDHIPAHELYMFPSAPPPADVAADMVVPNDAPLAYTFKLSQVRGEAKPGGSVKVVDATTFKAATAICAAEVTVNPGGMRELHWHPTQPEWTYFIEGNARVTLFAAQGAAQTFDFQGGDISFVPPSFGHYIENTGNTTLKFLEIFKSDRVQDISLNQWLALTPPALVKAHLGLDDATIARLSRVKQSVVGPAAPGA